MECQKKHLHIKYSSITQIHSSGLAFKCIEHRFRLNNLFIGATAQVLVFVSGYRVAIAFYLELPGWPWHGTSCLFFLDLRWFELWPWDTGLRPWKCEQFSYASLLIFRLCESCVTRFCKQTRKNVSNLWLWVCMTWIPVFLVSSVICISSECITHPIRSVRCLID